MTTSARWRQRFLVRGVFWRQFLRWAVLNVPVWLEPVIIAAWALIFLLWGHGRRGVMLNLKAIKPGSSTLANVFRTYRVFWNFAWTMADNVRFKELRTIPDWEFQGIESFERLLATPGGAIILTAHMGSYDLGAQLFAETSSRSVVMVRAPETDPETLAYEQQLHERTAGKSVTIGFSGNGQALAFDLLAAVQRGEVVAIQGDRVTPGVGSRRVKLFGKETEIPVGPFALAMASRAPVHPLFVMRIGRRRYRLVTPPPIEVTRRSRDREHDLNAAVGIWATHLENAIREGWYQWFNFEPYYATETAAS